MLKLCPLGAGAEVGRSCLILRFKGKCIMLDCGLLPSFSGEEALPLLREIDPAEVDIVIITHFHIDHCAALPHFTERMAGFRGRIFATHPTLAVMRMVLQDFVRVNKIAQEDDDSLYSQEDVDRCLARMEPLDLRQRLNVGGVHITFYNAGHVLGACMALLEIAGVSILYTGDYSCEEDRHLMAAEVPPGVRPDLLIVEATYGMQVHERREDRERRFIAAVEKVVRRGGRCLIPVFALGRAQELMLILEEHWAANPDLRPVPIYHASRMADRSLDVYRSATSYMNTRIQAAVGVQGGNPWQFQYVKPIQRKDFRDAGPCVMLAAPGMLQQGFSRELFDRWCEDPRNGVVLAGYSVEGTLARQLEANPTEVESSSRRRLLRRCLIERVSFSAHADSVQTAKFVEQVKPCAIVLVHGERSEMARLHSALSKKYEGSPGFRGCRMPSNNMTFTMAFTDQKIARVVGKLAERAMAWAMGKGEGITVHGEALTGLLVTRNFEHLLLSPGELPQYTTLATHTVQQKLHLPYRSSYSMLRSFVRAMYAECSEGREAEEVGGTAARRFLTVADLVTLTHAPPDRVLLTWKASPQADMIADSLVAVISQAEVSQGAIRATSRPCGHAHHQHNHGSASAGAQPHPAGEGEQRSAPHAAGESTGSESPIDPVSEVACLVDVPWAKAVLSSDSGPFSAPSLPTALLVETGAGPVQEEQYMASAGEDERRQAAQREGELPVPVRRRRNHLLSVLQEQYGRGSVSYACPVAEPMHGVDAGGVEGEAQRVDFAINVQLDRKSAVIQCSSSSARGGAAWSVDCPDDLMRSAVARLVEVTDSMLKPVLVGQMSTYSSE